MNKKLFLLPFLLLLGAGCANSTQNLPTATSTPHPTSMNESSSTPTMQHTMTTGAVLAGNRVILDTRAYPQFGTTTFSFKLLAQNGSELTDKDLKIAHEKKMHFLLVRDDMTQFQHLHPEYKEGKWTVSTNIPEAGQYQLYIDIAPEKEAAVVLRVPVTIGGTTTNAKAPTPNADMSAIDNSITAKLTTNKALTTNQEITLTFTLTKNGQLVQEIEPYLGAYGHVVLLRHGNPNDFFHVHPITDTKPVNGQIRFAATFPEQGRYTLYAQFNISGTIELFPITVDVTSSGSVAPQSDDGSMMHHN